MILVAISGKKQIKKHRQRAKQQIKQTVLLAPGPHNYPIILKGFKLKLILPTGSGNLGSMLGSFLPFPTGHCFTLFAGTNSKLQSTFPAGIKLFYLSLF